MTVGDGQTKGGETAVQQEREKTRRGFPKKCFLVRGVLYPPPAGFSPAVRAVALHAFLMNQLSVGDPAASSLSSCLCAFPGGVSLLTETGLLRPFLVPETSNGEEGSAADAEVIVAAPLRLSEPSPEGTFPVGADVPVDHAWSQDGNILVVLRRSSYTAYCRDSKAEAEAAEVTPHRLDDAVLSQHRQPTGEGIEGSTEPESSTRTPPSRRDAPSLGLAEVHTENNGFEGKVVSCCLLGSCPREEAAAATKSTISSEESGQHSSNRGSGGRTYLIAVGGAFGVECYGLEFRQCSEEVGTEKRKQASLQDGGTGNLTASATTCRPLASIFEGYPVVALAFSRDSGLMAAASMTGHVKVWDVAALVAPPSSQQSNNVLVKKESVARGRGGGKKKRFGDAPSATRPLPGYGRHSGIAALWGIAVRAMLDVGAGRGSSLASRLGGVCLGVGLGEYNYCCWVWLNPSVGVPSQLIFFLFSPTVLKATFTQIQVLEPTNDSSDPTPRLRLGSFRVSRFLSPPPAAIYGAGNLFVILSRRQRNLRAGMLGRESLLVPSNYNGRSHGISSRCKPFRTRPKYRTREPWRWGQRCREQARVEAGLA